MHQPGAPGLRPGAGPLPMNPAPAAPARHHRTITDTRAEVAPVHAVPGESELVVHQPVPQLMNRDGVGKLGLLRRQREARQTRDDHGERIFRVTIPA